MGSRVVIADTTYTCIRTHVCGDGSGVRTEIDMIPATEITLTLTIDGWL